MSGHYCTVCQRPIFGAAPLQRLCDRCGVTRDTCDRCGRSMGATYTVPREDVGRFSVLCPRCSGVDGGNS